MVGESEGLGLRASEFRSRFSIWVDDFWQGLKSDFRPFRDCARLMGLAQTGKAPNRSSTVRQGLKSGGQR